MNRGSRPCVGGRSGWCRTRQKANKAFDVKAVACLVDQVLFVEELPQCLLAFWASQNRIFIREVTLLQGIYLSGRNHDAVEGTKRLQVKLPAQSGKDRSE